MHSKDKVTDGGKGWNGTLHWLETFGGSSLPGKVNYRHFFKNVNIFDNLKKHLPLSISNPKLKAENLDDFRRATIEPKKLNLVVSHPDFLKSNV